MSGSQTFPKLSRQALEEHRHIHFHLDLLAKAIEALTAGTLIYLILCVSLASIMGWVERRTAIPGLITAGRRQR